MRRLCGPSIGGPAQLQIQLVNLCDVIEIAKLGAGEELFPFSERISTDRTALTCIAEHHRVAVTRYHNARPTVTSTGDMPIKIPRG